MSTAESASTQEGNGGTIEQGATSLELFFDLVFRVRLHPGHELPLRPSHLGRGIAGRDTARCAVVGVDMLLVVDECSARRGSDERAACDPPRDGGHARRFAGRPAAFGDNGVFFGLAYFVVR